MARVPPRAHDGRMELKDLETCIACSVMENDYTARKAALGIC